LKEFWVFEGLLDLKFSWEKLFDLGFKVFESF